MPRTARLLDLISALGQRPRPLATLARDFGVSERTLYRDLAELQGLYVPIVRDERGYRLVEGTTTRPLPLSSEERAVLRLALANPSLKRNPAYRRRLEGIEGKLDTLARATDESPAGLALAGPDRSGEVGAEIVEQLERAIKRRLSVRVVYRSLSGSGSTARGIDPWAVVHRASAWYLLGRCHVHAEPRTFRLDRIQSVETTTPAPPHPANFDLETYLRDTWGIWRGDQVWAITLEFAASLAPLLEHAHHHNGETVTTREDGSVLYQVNLSHLEEIARWVVGFGGRCRVVAPAELRARVREIAEGAIAAMGTAGTTSVLAKARTIEGVDFSGLFSFTNPNNLEMLVKVLDACSLNNRFWVYFAATTNVRYRLSVRDTETGQIREYTNVAGNTAEPVQDSDAFACNVVSP